MTDSAENHTIRLLQEMRTKTNGRFDDLSSGINDLVRRVDGNTLLLNLVAGVLHEDEQRLSHLESKSS